MHPGIIGSAIVLSPLIGLLLAMLLVLATSWLAMRATPFAVDRRFRVLQFVSSALLSLAHGGNDAQKTMGIITVLLYSQGLLTGAFHVPLWVVLSCQSAMALGTKSERATNWAYSGCATTCCLGDRACGSIPG